MFGIIGSGFGLYGHMPAICGLSTEKVLLPKRYLPVFEKRTELSLLRNQIQWLEDEESVIERAETIVLSLWPKGQEELIKTCLSYAHIKAIALEKPLASTPADSIDLLQKLRDSDKIFRINYAFIYTAWFSQLKDQLKEAKTIKINWNFLAHHYKHDLHNWKRQVSAGGGVIRFFGIHLIAILSALNFDEVSYSKAAGMSDEDIYEWKAGFKNKEGILCEVVLDSCSSTEQFAIDVTNKTENTAPLHIHLKNPFGDVLAPSNGLDKRVQGLTELYKSLSEKNESESCYRLYQLTNTLWQTVEELTVLNKVQKQIIH